MQNRYLTKFNNIDHLQHYEKLRIEGTPLKNIFKKKSTSNHIGLNVENWNAFPLSLGTRH